MACLEEIDQSAVWTDCALPLPYSVLLSTSSSVFHFFVPPGSNFSTTATSKGDLVKLFFWQNVLLLLLLLLCIVLSVVVLFLLFIWTVNVHKALMWLQKTSCFLTENTKKNVSGFTICLGINLKKRALEKP